LENALSILLENLKHSPLRSPADDSHLWALENSNCQHLISMPTRFRHPFYSMKTIREVTALKTPFPASNREKKSSVVRTVCLLDDLKTPFDPSFYCCGCDPEKLKSLSVHAKVKYQCTVCENFTLCVDCFQLVAHEHEGFVLTQLPNAPVPSKQKSSHPLPVRPPRVASPEYTASLWVWPEDEGSRRCVF
jgi:hypothetical protein